MLNECVLNSVLIAYSAALRVRHVPVLLVEQASVLTGQCPQRPIGRISHLRTLLSPIGLGVSARPARAALTRGDCVMRRVRLVIAMVAVMAMMAVSALPATAQSSGPICQLFLTNGELGYFPNGGGRLLRQCVWLAYVVPVSCLGMVRAALTK
jgi:hypothetical protein